MASTHETVAVLRDLIRLCRDGADGYRAAAERVDDAEMSALFVSYAEQRTTYLGELEAELRRLGEDPRDMPTLGDALASSWTSIRGALSSNDRKAVIAQIESAEDAAVAIYHEAVGAPLPGPILEIVKRQYEGVRLAHDRLRAIEKRSG